MIESLRLDEKNMQAMDSIDKAGECIVTGEALERAGCKPRFKSEHGEIIADAYTRKILSGWIHGKLQELAHDGAKGYVEVYSKVNGKLTSGRSHL